MFTFFGPCNRLGCWFLKVSKAHFVKDCNKHQHRILHQTGRFMIHGACHDSWGLAKQL